MILKFRTPVFCQNYHKAFWYWKVSPTGIAEVRNYGVPDDQKCSCPKQGLGEGYVRAGHPDQLFTGWLDRETQQNIYEGDIVIASYHWTEWHIIRLPQDFYDIQEFALGDDLSVVGNIFMNPEMAKATR